MAFEKEDTFLFADTIIDYFDELLNINRAQKNAKN